MSELPGKNRCDWSAGICVFKSGRSISLWLLQIGDQMVYGDFSEAGKSAGLYGVQDMRGRRVDKSGGENNGRMFGNSV